MFLFVGRCSGSSGLVLDHCQETLAVGFALVLAYAEGVAEGEDVGGLCGGQLVEGLVAHDEIRRPALLLRDLPTEGAKGFEEGFVLFAGNCGCKVDDGSGLLAFLRHSQVFADDDGEVGLFAAVENLCAEGCDFEVTVLVVGDFERGAPLIRLS